MEKEDSLQHFSIFLMERIIKNYRQLAQKSLDNANSGLTVDQWVTLKFISENNGCSQVEIADSTIKDAPTNTRIIDFLSNKNLIFKEMDAEDRRKFKVFVTQEGRNLIEKLMPIVAEYRKVISKNVNSEEKTRLDSLLKKILQNLS
jgi:DNA-binding MarR family transcriptional regulator